MKCITSMDSTQGHKRFSRGVSELTGDEMYNMNGFYTGTQEV